MKIRYTSPVVFTSDGKKIITQMEHIGFHITHEKENAGGTGVILTTMKDDIGNPMCVVENERFTTPFSGIRINVDDFFEALEEFESLGYMNLQAGATETGTSHATLLRSKEGIFVSLAEHI